MGLTEGLKQGSKVALRTAVAVPKATVVGFWRGLTYPFKGAKLVYLKHPELVRFWAPPIFITMLVLAFIAWGGWAAHEPLVNWIWSDPTDPGFWGDVARFFHSVVEILVLIVMWLAGAALVVGLTNVLAAPFNDLLSEEVEHLVTGAKGPEFSLKVILRDTVRSVRLELTKLIIYLLVMGPTFLLSLLLPAIGQVIYSIFGFLFTAMYFAMDFIDWPASRRNQGVRFRFGLMGKHFLPMLGFGTGVWLLLFIPLVNLLFMPAAVAGGTLLYLDLERAKPSPEPPAPHAH